MQKIYEVDNLLEWYKKLMPKTVYLTKNKVRYNEALKAISEIVSCTVASDSSAEIKVEPDQLTGTSLCVEINASLVIINMLDKFCTALQKADNFEVIPLTNGNVSLGLTFEDVFVPVFPRHLSEVK